VIFINRETVFTQIITNSSGKELHFDVDQRNVVTWQIIPEGEAGSTRPFASISGAEHFMERYAKRLGFTNRISNFPLEKSVVNV